MKKTNSGLLIVLLCASFAHAEGANELVVFEPLVGGQWVSAARLPNGQEVRSRTVWSWGVGKKLVRLRHFSLGTEGEVQQYESILFFHPTKKRIEYRVFSRGGLVSSGVAVASKDGVTLEQPASPSFPAMRTAYAIAEKDRCTARVSFRGEVKWNERIVTNMRRDKIERYKTLKLDRGVSPLEPLSRFVGRWLGADAQESIGAWSLHRRLLHLVNKTEERFVSFDVQQKTIVCFLIDSDGHYAEGEVSMENKVSTWTLTRHPGEQKELHINTSKGAGLHVWSTQRFVDGKWTTQQPDREMRRLAEKAASFARAGWLVGGQWNSSSKLPNGMPIVSRMVVDWGPQRGSVRKSMRMRTFMKRGETDAQVYEAVLYWSAQNNRMQYTTFAANGAIYKGTARIAGDVLILEQHAQGRFPASRHVFSPNPGDKDRYSGATYWQRGNDWQRAMQSETTRAPLKPFGANAPAASTALASMQKLLGEWQCVQDGTRVRYERSLSGALIVALEPSGWTFHYWDGKAKKIRSLRVSAEGDATNKLAEAIEWIDKDQFKLGEQSTTYRRATKVR